MRAEMELVSTPYQSHDQDSYISFATYKLCDLREKRPKFSSPSYEIIPLLIHPTTLLCAYYVSSRDLSLCINSFGEQKSTCIHKAYVPITKYF